MFVGAGDKHRLITQQTVPSGDGIGGNGRVGVPDVRGIIDIVDRGGDVKPAHKARLPEPTRSVSAINRNAKRH